MEMSFTLNNAGEIIKGLREKYGDDLVVGAGTVLDSETARHAVLCGAQFIIAPTYDEGVAKVCNRYQIPYAPGCTTVTEAVNSLSMGAAYIKAFPISDFYGPKLLKIFKTPIPDHADHGKRRHQPGESGDLAGQRRGRVRIRRTPDQRKLRGYRCKRGRRSTTSSRRTDRNKIQDIQSGRMYQSARFFALFIKQNDGFDKRTLKNINKKYPIENIF